MAQLIIPNAGKIWWATWAIQSTSTPENLTLRLFTNDFTPSSSSTSTSFTECTMTGYSAVTLSRSSWGTPAIVNGAAVSTYGGSISFSCTGGSGATCYGWYVLGGTHTTTCMMASRFDLPFVFTSGTTLNLTLTFGEQ